MGRNVSEQIVQSPYLCRKFGLRENPPAPQSAQPVRLCEARGGDEFGALMKGRARELIKQGLEINFVNQHPCSDPPRNFPNLPERIVVDQSTTRVMHVREHDKPGAICYRALQFTRVNTKPVFEPPLETHDPGV